MMRRFNKLLAFPALFVLALSNNFSGQTPAPKTTKSEMKNTNYRSPAEIPMEAFFRNPEKTSFRISPDGKRIAYLAPINGRMNVHIQTLGQSDVKKLTDVTDRDIASLDWGNDTHLIYSKDNGGDENFMLYVLDINSGKSIPVVKTGRTEIVDLLENDDDHFVFSNNARSNTLFDLYKFDFATNKVELLLQNPGDVTGWLLDHEGNPRLLISTDGVTTRITHRSSTAKPEVILETNFKESITPLFFDFENKHVYCSSNLDRDKSAIVLFDIERKREIQMIYEHPEVDVYTLNYSRKRKVLTTVLYETDKMNREILDAEMKTTLNSIASKLPANVSFEITDADKAESKFIVRSYSDVSLGAYYVYDVKSKELKLLESLSPWLPENMMCEMKPVTYTASDGAVIHGYLTLPKTGGMLLPVVVNPHGGPWARDSWGFNPEVQFLASRGYAVFQMNFTGSVGYGKSFWEKSFKQWGQRMQEDITDGVHYLIDQRIADPKRIAIYGGSYGGYATLAGLTFTADLYACGIDYVGVSNLFTFMESIPPYWEPYRQMLYEMVGDPEKDKIMLTDYSPVFKAEKITAPLLIAQGAKDPRVNVNESEQMVEALSKRGVKVQYIVEPEEGHGFHNEENRFKFYRAMESFLFQHLGMASKLGPMKKSK